MSDQKNFEKEKEFIQKYFKSITELPLDQLKKYLAKHNVKEIKEGNGKQAIHFAASRGDLEIFKYIASLSDVNQLDGISINYIDKKNNAFLIAVQHEHKPIVQYLLDECHVDVNYSRESITALHLAAQLDNIALIELLLSCGANIDALSDHGTPLMFAAASGKRWSAELLIKKGANPNLTSAVMPPLLHLLIDSSNYPLFKYLLENPSLDVNIKDPQGWSAVHLAAEKGELKMLEDLIALKADIDYENQGYSALDSAVQHGQWPCVEVLRQLAVRKQHQVIEQLKELTEEEQKDLLKVVLELKQEGNALFAQQQYQEAKEAYERAVNQSKPIQQKYPNEVVPLYTNLAQSFIKLDQPKEALAICQQARSVQSKWVKIYFFEGQSYEMIQEFGEAAASYFDALKIENNQLFKQLFDKAIQKGKEAHQESLKKK